MILDNFPKREVTLAGMLYNNETTQKQIQLIKRLATQHIGKMNPKKSTGDGFCQFNSVCHTVQSGI